MTKQATETPVLTKPPTRKQLEDALIRAGIAQSNPKFLGGRVAFVFSPRLPIQCLFGNLDTGVDEFGPYGVTLDRVFEGYPSLAENKEATMKALEIARGLGWDEHNGGISDTW